MTPDYATREALDKHASEDAAHHERIENALYRDSDSISNRLGKIEQFVGGAKWVLASILLASITLVVNALLPKAASSVASPPPVKAGP